MGPGEPEGRDERDQRQDGQEPEQHLKPPGQSEKSPIALEEFLVELRAPPVRGKPDPHDDHGGQCEGRRSRQQQYVRHLHAETHGRRVVAAARRRQQGGECEQKAPAGDDRRDG